MACVCGGCRPVRHQIYGRLPTTPGRARSNDLAGRSTALAPPCLLATRSHILKLQFNTPNSISVGAPLQTPLGHRGELTALPRPPTWILGVLLLREARGGEEAKKENGGEGTKRGREGKGGRPLHPLPLPNSLRHWVDDQARPSRRPGLCVT